MADDVQIADTSSGDAPHDYTVPSSADFILKAAYGVFDGTSASGNFLPALEIVSDSGHTVARSVGTAVTAGASAEVSWFPFAPPASSGGGGGTSIALEITEGDSATVAAGSSYTFNFGPHTGGSNLLDYSTPTFPAVLAAGWYQMLCGFGIQGTVGGQVTFAANATLFQQYWQAGSGAASVSYVQDFSDVGTLHGSPLGWSCQLSSFFQPMKAEQGFELTVVNEGTPSDSDPVSLSLNYVVVNYIAASFPT